MDQNCKNRLYVWIKYCHFTWNKDQKGINIRRISNTKHFFVLFSIYCFLMWRRLHIRLSNSLHFIDIEKASFHWHFNLFNLFCLCMLAIYCVFLMGVWNFQGSYWRWLLWSYIIRMECNHKWVGMQSGLARMECNMEWLQSGMFGKEWEWG